MRSRTAQTYRALSLVYDRWQRSYGRDYSSIILPRLLQMLRWYGLRRSAMLDLACGTGSLAFKMARRGWEVTGVDGSAGMLAEARRKRAAAELSVRLLRQNMERLRVHRAVSLVTCFFDSLNHLSSLRALDRTVRAVNRALLPGGYFVFDVNNERCYRRLWTLTDSFRRHDFLLILKNSYAPAYRLATSRVTLFIFRNGTVERHCETIHERCYTNAEIRNILTRNGFEVCEREDFNFTDVPHVGKIKTWWVARKVSGTRPSAMSGSGRSRTRARGGSR